MQMLCSRRGAAYSKKMKWHHRPADVMYGDGWLQLPTLSFEFPLKSPRYCILITLLRTPSHNGEGLS